MNGHKLLVAAFVIAIGIIAWQDIAESNAFPRPARMVSAGIVFFILGLVSALGAPALAGALGVGMDLSLLFQLNWAKLAGTGEDKPKNPFAI